MYEPSRISTEYINGVNEFMKCALADMKKKCVERMLCPCLDCGNNKWQPSDEVRSHLIRRGFKKKYTTWYWHGEVLKVL